MNANDIIITITIQPDGTFKRGNKDLTLEQVVDLSRNRRKAARAAAKRERDAKKTERQAERQAKVVARAEKLVAELKELGTPQAVIDDLTSKLAA